MTNLEERVTEIRRDIYEHIFSTRRDKYKWFFRALRIFRYMPGNKDRGEFLETFYLLMRYIDDIVDGSHPRNLPIELRPSYVEGRIKFAADSKAPVDDADFLMLHCFDLAEQLGLDFTQETLDILASLHFDALRIGKLRIYRASELSKNFYMLDISGTTGLALKLFREDPRKRSWLEELAIASRIYYNLRDFEEDIQSGFINIPYEDINVHGITKEDLERVQSPRIKEWFRAQSNLGIELLSKYREIRASEQFKLLTKLTLMFVYYRPARRYFERVLKA